MAIHPGSSGINPLAPPVAVSKPESEIEQEYDRQFWIWMARWAFRFVLAAIGISGLYHASAAPSRGGYWCGLGAFVLIVLALFWHLKREFDGVPGAIGFDILCRNLGALWFVIPVHAALGMAGLVFAARTESVAIYYAGLALGIWCSLAVFLNMKAAFDATEAAG